MDAGEPSCSPVKPSQSSSSSSEAPPPSVFGRQEFKPDERNAIRELLQQKLGKEHLATRPGSAGVSFTYVESWKAIELANQIFGFNGWSSAVVDITPDYIEQSGKGRYSVGVTAVVKVMLKDGTYHEDVGYGMAEHPKKGSAIENAKKEAVSDARKRALRLFGNALGNCLYDKEHLVKLKNAKKGEAGYLPPTVSNPAHDAEKASLSSSSSSPSSSAYDGGFAVPSQSSQLPLAAPPTPQAASSQSLPGGYNVRTANIAGRVGPAAAAVGGGQPAQQGFGGPAAAPQQRASALPVAAVANGQQPAGEVAPDYDAGSYDEHFLSAALAMSDQPASSSPQPAYNGGAVAGAKRGAPDSGFGYGQQQQQQPQQQPPQHAAYGARQPFMPQPQQQHYGGTPPDKRPRHDGS